MTNKNAACLISLFVIATASAGGQVHLDTATNPTYRLDFSPLPYGGTACAYGFSTYSAFVSASFTDLAPQSTYRIELFSLATGLLTTSCIQAGFPVCQVLGQPSVGQDWVANGLGVQVTTLSGSMNLQQLTAHYSVVAGGGPCAPEYVPYATYRTTLNVVPVPEPSTVVLVGLSLVSIFGVHYQKSNYKRPSNALEPTAAASPLLERS